MHTVVAIICCPVCLLDQACSLQKLFAVFGREFETLFHLDAFSCRDLFTQNSHIAHRGVEGLVVSALDIVDVLANDGPVVQLEGVLSQNLICSQEAIEYEPVRVEW